MPRNPIPMSRTSPRTKTFGFGGCAYALTSPQRDALNGSTAMLNVAVPFEEALKLSLALEECIRRLNSYNRATRAGKRSAVNVAIHLNKGRITINETKLDSDGG